MIRIAIIASMLALFFVGAADAKLHKGTALIQPGPAWDFSDSVAVVPPAGDLSWVTLVARNVPATSQAGQLAWFVTNLPALIAYASEDSTFEQLSWAPTDITTYSETAAVVYGLVYVIRTKELHYAKLKVEDIGGGGITIRYAYQDDGTRVLAEPVAVAPTTWGRVKSLYR